jgi:hypothetical protein
MEKQELVSIETTWKGRKGLMTVGNLIKELQKLDPELLAVSFDNEYGDYDGFTTIEAAVAGKGHPQLPEGTGYADVIFRERLKLPDPIIPQCCTHCGTVYRQYTRHTHCYKCSWLPMLKILEDTNGGAG